MAWLTPDELYRLTRKKRFSAQRKVLERRKIPFKAADNGEPLVRDDWDAPKVDARGKPAQGVHRWDRIVSIRNLRP